MLCIAPAAMMSPPASSKTGLPTALQCSPRLWLVASCILQRDLGDGLKWKKKEGVQRGSGTGKAKSDSSGEQRRV